MEEIIDLNHLQTLVMALQNPEVNIKRNRFVVKFTADWCAPCQGIKPIVDKYIEQEKNNPNTRLRFYEVNIDESIDIYMKFKKMRMINGIPAMLYYDGNQTIDSDTWFIPHDCVLGGNKTEVEEFLNRVATNR